jgi:TetR/AcrR family transcriptional repressor of mexAB-oprM operon
VRLPPEQMAERLSGCDGIDPLLSLRNLSIEAIENLARDAQKQRIFTILLHRCEFTDELRETERQHNDFINQFISLVENLLSRPECQARLQPGVTPRLAARALHAQVVGLFTDWTRDPELFDPLRDTAGLIDPVLRGLVRDWDSAAHEPPANGKAANPAQESS